MILIAKLRTNWRTVVLGLGAGLFSSGLCLVTYRIDEHARELREAQARAAMPFRMGCDFQRDPNWWIYVAGVHILLYVAATLVIYRFLFKRETSVFMLWQYIGASVIAGWFLLLSLEMLPRLLDGWAFHIVSPMSPAGGKVAAVAFAANVIYGTSIHLFAKRRDALK